jgi:AraC family ethanolamine operon transcriptional activator
MNAAGRIFRWNWSKLQVVERFIGKTAAMDPSKGPPGSSLPEFERKVSVLCVTDPTAVGEALEDYGMDVINLDLEEFEYKQVTVPLDECVLIYQHTNKALRTRSRIYEQFESCFVLGPNAYGSFDGRKLNPFDLIAAGPGAQAELVIDEGFDIVALILPPHGLDKHLELRGKSRDFDIPIDPEVWNPETEAARDLFELGKRIVEAAEETPSIFNDNHWARYGAQVDFIDALLAAIESCSHDEQPDTDKKGTPYSQIVRTCEDYTLGLEGRRPYMSELCEAAHVSERTLQKAFKEIMGMSPVTYLHRLRLHRARDELRNAETDSTTVTDVALNWGFWHFGEFSRTYKNCFGEVPSHTLKQASDV